MKKVLVTIISLLLIATMLFGCGKKNEEPKVPNGENLNVDAAEDNRITAQKFIDGLSDLLSDTQAAVDNFNKISFEKGVYGEVSGFEIMGKAMRVNVGYDIANNTIGATLIQKNVIGPDSKIDFVFYGDYCYVDFGTSKTKVTPDKITTLLRLFMGLDVDVEVPAESIDLEKIKNVVLALKDYNGNLAEDLIKLANEKFTWTETADEISVVIAGESILAFKDAAIELIVNNEGVKDKITKEDIDEIIGEIDEDAVKAFGVITVTLILKDAKATSLKFNFFTSKQDEKDVNVSDYTQIDGSLDKIDGGANVKIVEKTWKTDGTGEAYERVQEVLADGEIKLNGNVLTYKGLDYDVEATIGESDIKVMIVKEASADGQKELNLYVVIKGLEEEIKAPEN